MGNTNIDEIRIEISTLKERLSELEKRLDNYIIGLEDERDDITVINTPATAEEVLAPTESVKHVQVEEDLPEPIVMEPDVLTSIEEDGSPTYSEPIDLGIDIPEAIETAQVRSINDIQSKRTTKRIMDTATETPAWKKDRPGTPVKNIISAISLNDRVLFIRSLFREDPMLFQQTIAELNAMKKLEEGEKYLLGHFPEWKMNSDIVYRFMMAVRRKLVNG